MHALLPVIERVVGVGSGKRAKPPGGATAAGPNEAASARGRHQAAAVGGVAVTSKLAR